MKKLLLSFLIIINFRLITSAHTEECEGENIDQCLVESSKSKGQEMVAKAEKFMEIIPLEISDYLLGHEKVQGKHPVAQWNAIAEIFSKDNLSEFVADNIEFFNENFKAGNPNKQIEKLEALRNIWATAGREFSLSYQNFIETHQRCREKDEFKNKCFQGKTPSFDSIKFDSEKLDRLLSSDFNEDQGDPKVQSIGSEADVLEKQKRQESQCEDVFENYGQLIQDMKGGKYTPKEISEKRLYISKCIDWCLSNPFLKDRFPELCAADRDSRLTNFENLPSSLSPNSGLSSSKSTICNIMWNQPWVDNKGRVRGSRNLNYDDLCPQINGYFSIFKEGLIDSLGIIQGEFEKQEARFPLDANGALAKAFDDSAIGRSKPEDYPEIVRRFAIAKSLEGNCENFGGNPKVPRSCGKIPGIKKMKCKKIPRFNKKGIVRNAHALRNLYIRRDLKMQQWEETKKMAGAQVLNNDGSMSGYAMPLVDKTGKAFAAGAFILLERDRHNEELRKIDMEMLSLVKDNPILMADFKEYKDPYRPSKLQAALNPAGEGLKYAFNKTKEFFHGYDASFQEQELHKKIFVKGLTDFDISQIDNDEAVESATSPLIEHALVKNSKKMTQTLQRLCEMPNDKLVRQKFFTSMLNEKFPSLKAAHECELSKLSPEQLKDGLKDAQAGLAMSCMTFMAGGPTAAGLSAACGTVYAGFSVWAMGENMDELGELQTCLAAIGKEMCGKEGKGISEVSSDFNISYDEAYLTVALLPLDFFDVLDLANGVSATRSAKSFRERQLIEAKGSAPPLELTSAQQSSVSSITARLSPRPETPAEARKLVTEVLEEIRDIRSEMMLSSKPGSEMEEVPLKHRYSRLEAEAEALEILNLEKLHEEINYVYTNLVLSGDEISKLDFQTAYEVLEKIKKNQIDPGNLEPETIEKLSLIQQKLMPVVEKQFLELDLDIEMKRIEKISDPQERARAAKELREDYFNRLENVGVLEPKHMRTLTKKNEDKIELLDDLIEQSGRHSHSSTDDLSNTLHETVSVMDFPTVPPPQYRNELLDSSSDEELSNIFDHSLRGITPIDQNPQKARKELFEVLQETKFKLSYLKGNGREAPELKSRVELLGNYLMNPSEDVKDLLSKVKSADNDDLRKHYADQAWELFQKEAMEDYDSFPSLVQDRLGKFKSELDQLATPRSYKNTNPPEFDFDDVALLKSTQRAFDDLNSKNLISGDSAYHSVLSVELEHNSAFGVLSDTRTRLKDEGKLDWFHDMIRPQNIKLETLIDDPSLITEIFKNAPGGPEYTLLRKQLKYFKDELGFELTFDPGCHTAGNGGYFSSGKKIIATSEVPYSYNKWVHEFQHAVKDKFIPDDNTFNQLVSEYKVKLNGGNPDDYANATRIIEGLKITGFYNERDMERLVHAISTPGMSDLGLDELLSVGMEMDAYFNLTEKGQVVRRFSKELREYFDDSYEYVTGNIKNQLTNKERLGTISPDEAQLLENIRTTGVWSPDEKFRTLYLQEEPTTPEEWTELFQRLNMNDKVDSSGRSIVDSPVQTSSNPSPVDSSDEGTAVEILEDDGHLFEVSDDGEPFISSSVALGYMSDAVKKGDINGDFQKSQTGEPMLVTEDGVFYFKDEGTYYSEHDSTEVVKVQ